MIGPPVKFMGTLRKYSSLPVSCFDTWTGIGSFTLFGTP